MVTCVSLPVHHSLSNLLFVPEYVNLLTLNEDTLLQVVFYSRS